MVGELKPPTIHLNGTSGTELFEAGERVYDALRATIEAMLTATPNARDYYVQGVEAFKEARTAFDHHMQALVEARDAWGKYLENVSEQNRCDCST